MRLKITGIWIGLLVVTVVSMGGLGLIDTSVVYAVKRAKCGGGIHALSNYAVRVYRTKYQKRTYEEKEALLSKYYACFKNTGRRIYLGNAWKFPNTCSNVDTYTPEALRHGHYLAVSYFRSDFCVVVSESSSRGLFLINLRTIKDVGLDGRYGFATVPMSISMNSHMITDHGMSTWAYGNYPTMQVKFNNGKSTRTIANYSKSGFRNKRQIKGLRILSPKREKPRGVRWKINGVTKFWKYRAARPPKKRCGVSVKKIGWFDPDGVLIGNKKDGYSYCLSGQRKPTPLPVACAKRKNKVSVPTQPVMDKSRKLVAYLCGKVDSAPAARAGQVLIVIDTSDGRVVKQQAVPAGCLIEVRGKRSVRCRGK